MSMPSSGMRRKCRKPPVSGRGGDAAAGDVLDTELTAAGRDFGCRHAVVEAVAGVQDVAEAVPLARGLGPEVVEVVVAVDLARNELHARGAAAEERRVRPVDAQVEREDGALADQPGGCDDALGCEKVEAAKLVIVPKEAPGGAGGGAGLDGKVCVGGEILGLGCHRWTPSSP